MERDSALTSARRSGLVRTRTPDLKVEPARAHLHFAILSAVNRARRRVLPVHPYQSLVPRGLSGIQVKRLQSKESLDRCQVGFLLRRPQESGLADHRNKIAPNRTSRVADQLQNRPR